VSVDADGNPGDDASTDAAVSGNGAQVAFASAATNLLPPGVGEVTLVRRRLGRVLAPVPQIMRSSPTVQNAVVQLISRGSQGAADGISRAPALSDDGGVVAFQSAANNLGTTATAGRNNIYVAVQQGSEAPGLPSPPPGSRRPVITNPESGRHFPLAGPTAVSFSWTGVPGVTRYFFEHTGANRQFATINGTTVDLVNGAGGVGGGFFIDGTGLAVTLDPSFPVGVYQVRVIGTAGSVFVGTFSDAVQVILGPLPVAGQGQPVLLSPVTGATVVRGGQVTFGWTGVAGADRYGFEFTGVNQIFTNPNGREPDRENGFGGTGGGFTVTGTGFSTTVPAELSPGIYQIRVIALGADLRPIGAFSDAVTLIVQ
jgi:hypothetical protein